LYVPGLISALLIPVLFWYYGNIKRNEPIPNIMDIELPAKLAEDKSNMNYTFEPLRNWKYKKIKVPSDKAKENSAFYVSEIKELQKRNEKNTGIEFIINDSNSYGDFASVLNDFHIAKHETYTLDLEKTGHLFAPVNYTDPSPQELNDDCLLCYDVIRDEYKPYFYENFISNVQQLSKEGFYIIFGFLLFLNFSMFSIKERFQFQKHH